MGGIRSALQTIVLDIVVHDNRHQTEGHANKRWAFVYIAIVNSVGTGVD